MLLRPGDTLILSGSDPLQGVEIIRCDDVSAPALTANDSTLALTPVVADGTLSLLEQGDSRSLQARQQLQD
ncbi:hypothetical protein, partial [Gilvimarinus sp. 1_MG-2023]|uniref:hypothetical protein n=1 Tax=Gilvimarinus sp. 1_MG-2023 TaxID=3062638 RepID=UPI0026E14C33